MRGYTDRDQSVNFGYRWYRNDDTPIRVFICADIIFGVFHALNEKMNFLMALNAGKMQPAYKDLFSRTVINFTTGKN